MQLSLPLFTSETTLINGNLGFFMNDGIVFYLLNGMPIYSHMEGDLQAFRFFISNLISQGLCKKAEIRKSFHVSIDYINRACRLYESEGEVGFFKPEIRHGYCHKLVGDNLILAQKLLDEHKNNCEIGRQCNVKESSIRYAIKVGHLKKNQTSIKPLDHSPTKEAPWMHWD
jgi:hypothetical protein